MFVLVLMDFGATRPTVLGQAEYGLVRLFGERDSF
jgi:hypothetical protein